MEEKRGEKASIYRHEPNDPDRQIMPDRKSKVEIKQNDRRLAFNRHFKKLEVNSQDGSAIMRRRGTWALKALFMGKRIASPCAVYCRKLK